MTLDGLVKQLTKLTFQGEKMWNDEVYAVFPREKPRKVKGVRHIGDRVYLDLDVPDDVR